MMDGCIPESILSQIFHPNPDPASNVRQNLEVDLVCSFSLMLCIIKADSHSVELSKWTEFDTVACYSSLTFYFNSKQHLNTKTKDFLSNHRKPRQLT